MENKKIIIYDFDGTLTPYSLPRFEILRKCGLTEDDVNHFFESIKEKVKKQDIDMYVAMYETYFETITNADFKLTDNNLCLGWDRVEYNKGVVEFLNNLDKGNIKNYLLSSGVKVFLDKLEIAGFFSKIYATTFNYDKNGEVVSIDYLMSDKNKVEAIKDIIKDNGFEKDDCSNIVYIGDGFTDLYAMEYVKKNNGTTIFVHQQDDIKAMNAIKEKEIVSFYTLADYSQNSELNQYINNICAL